MTTKRNIPKKTSLLIASILVVAGATALSGTDSSVNAERAEPGSLLCPIPDAPVKALSESGTYAICIQTDDETPVELVEDASPDPEIFAHEARIYWDFGPLLPFTGNQGIMALNHKNGGDTCFSAGDWVWCDLEDQGPPVEIIEVVPGDSVLCRSNLTVTVTNPDGATSFGPVDAVTPCI